MILLVDVAAAPLPVLRVWYANPPEMDEEAMERLCLRVEGCGMVGVDGKLIDMGACKR
jgi:hypothetical protein